MRPLKGSAIFSGAFVGLTTNVGVTARIICLPWLLATMFKFAPDFVVCVPLLCDAPNTGMTIVAIAATVLSLLAQIVLWVWLATGLYRYALLGEEPKGFIPFAPAARIGAVLWAMFKVLLPAIIAVVVGICLLFVVYSALLGNLDGLSDPTLDAIALGLIYFMFLRFGIVLPAAAVGATMGLAEAWKRTRPLKWTVFVLAVVLGILSGGFSALNAEYPQSHTAYLISTLAFDLIFLLALASLAVIYWFAAPADKPAT